jgi:low affinity Fe/Cu permease
MSIVRADMSINELLRVAADHHHKRITLSDEERSEVIAALKRRGQDELEYGEEVTVDAVRLVKRVTGAVGVYFS